MKNVEIIRTYDIDALFFFYFKYYRSIENKKLNMSKKIDSASGLIHENTEIQ